MKAVGLRAYGAIDRADALVDFQCEKPSAPKGFDLLVRVEAVSVNPVDWKVRSGGFDNPSNTFDPPKVS